MTPDTDGWRTGRAIRRHRILMSPIFSGQHKVKSAING